MKNFDPIGYTRQKWSDPKHIKNRPHSCQKSHIFCNIEYEWATDVGKMRPINRPVNSAFPNVDLPMSSQKVVSVNYDSITEENLDDWFAQSMNRSLASMLNPQKKFFIPPNYEEDLRQRYRKNKQLKKLGEDETYFDMNQNRKKSKGYPSGDRKKKININELCFDYKKLQPHQEMMGTPIKIRQMKKVHKKEIHRRNAVLLGNDVHYARFLREFNKEKEKDKTGTVMANQEKALVPTKDKIYSYNLQSMNRRSCYDNVPTSLIENEYERIKQPDKDLLTSHRALMSTQEELHEKYRLLMNQKTNNAISQIKQLTSATVHTPQQIVTGLLKKKVTSLLHHKNPSHPSIEASKQKKSLESMVIKLLNDMQVQSESINEDMANLNIHVQQILLQHPDSRPQTKWILKAQEKIKDKKNLLAIDCYKQAIILQPELFIPVFNIAVLLEKENMLESARLWFNLAKEFQTDSENVLFGVSLVALKQLRYSESLAGINELIHKLESSSKSILPVYFYIRALCNKELQNHSQAKQDYNQIIPEIKPTNFDVLPNFIFSVVFGRLRRIHLQFNCLSYMLFRDTLFLILYERGRKMRENGELLVAIADKLMSGRFFSRFSINLVRKLLKSATYEQKDKGDIIFSSKNETAIIISGIVSLKSHEKQFKRPEMVSVLEVGGVIGAGELENNISAKPNNWFMAQSKVQLIKVPKQDFYLFWKGQITFQMDFKYNFLKNVQLFKNLPECTLFKLCELFEKKVYGRGEILFNDCSYRVEMLSKPGKGYGLTKSSQSTDIRMVHSQVKVNSKQIKSTERRHKSRWLTLLKKHIFKFNELKFNRIKFPGLFVVSKGTVELEDDRGFRCNGMIGERDFFGENLFIDSDGYHNYGRMVAETEQVEVLLLSVDKLVWMFTQQDKNTMINNCKGRETVDTIRFLRNRFTECQHMKLEYKFKNKN